MLQSTNKINEAGVSELWSYGTQTYVSVCILSIWSQEVHQGEQGNFNLSKYQTDNQTDS